MVSFTLSLLALVIGYLLYGRFVERVFGPDNRPTPAVAMADGVDFIVMPNWKIFMIQFLNIAGTGPIFGAHGTDRWPICGSCLDVSSPEPCTTISAACSA